MSLPNTAVIGGGVVGAAVAYYLARQGAPVTLFEQDEICSGCSQGNAGQVTPGHLPLPQPGTLLRNVRWLFSPTSPLFIAPRWDPELVRWLWRFQQACNEQHLHQSTKFLCQLGKASAALFAELSRDLGVRYQCEGRLEVYRTMKSFRTAGAEAELLREFGFRSQQLNGDEIRKFEPAIDAEVAGGIYYPNSGSCNPHLLVKRLAEAAEAHGATIRQHTAVADLRVEGKRLVAVVTPQGEFRADAMVLACGSWSPRLARRLGLYLPVQPGKGYHLDVSGLSRIPRVPVVLVEERIFVTPMDDFLRLAGTMEFSGFNLTCRPARIAMLARGAGRYFPEIFHAGERSRWCHLRPMTPDGLPIIGRVPRFQNVWIATGHGMLGVTQGPVTGQLLADWVVRGEPAFDLTTLRPERFQKNCE